MDILIFSIITNFLYYCAGNIVINEKKNNFHNQFYLYFVGIIFISIISLFFNFFVKLSPSFNTLVYIIIILLFTIKTKFYITRKSLKFLFLSSLITFLLIIFSNINRPDAGLYHLPFISLINEYKIIFGANNIHFRFGHISIIQYLSAINFNLLFKENGITIPLASITSFFYIYFFYDIWRVIKKQDRISVSNFFSLFVTIYIVYKITRYSSFGNDAIAHLSLFYLISYTLKTKLEDISIKRTFLISVFIFINKTTLGLAFIIPSAIFLFKKKFRFKKILNLIVSPASLLLVLWLIKNVIISGCLIYPVKATCFDKLLWTDKDQIIKISTQSEAWSKGWPDRIDKNISFEKFNKDFNWINAWSQKHLKKIIKTISPYLIILFIVIFFIKKNYKYSKFKIYDDLRLRIAITLGTMIIGSISFFLTFPLYRYGYSYLISSFILIAILAIIKDIENKKNIKIFKFLFIFCLSFLVIKQSVKIISNSSNDRWPNLYSLSENKLINKKEKIKIIKDFYYYQSVTDDFLCMYSKAPCTSYKINDNIYHLKIFSYSILAFKNKL